MIIGDSLHSDIQGGQQAKIQTVWLNPTSAPATQPFNLIIRFNS